MNELIDIVLEYYKHDEKLGFEFLLSLAEEIKDKEENFYGELLESIKEKAFEIEKCPNCYEELENNSYDEYRDEAWDKPTYEKIYSKYCSNCGWSKE